MGEMETGSAAGLQETSAVCKSLRRKAGPFGPYPVDEH